jgi:HlyD family secretion protein
MIVSITNDNTVSAEQTASLNLLTAENALQNARDALKNYNLTSPISGTVIQKTSKAGDTIASTVNASTMAIIADMTSLVLNINVDELDILDMKVGMTAMITADALPGQFFMGTITNVSSVGKATSGSSSMFSFGGFSGTGVTNYEVEITITDYGTLLPGMNVNASIVTASANNVLMVPQQAVVFGGFVLKKLDGTQPSPSMPAAPAQGQSSQAGQFGGGFSMQPTAPSGYEYVKVASMPAFGMFGMGPGGFGAAVVRFG